METSIPVSSGQEITILQNENEEDDIQFVARIQGDRIRASSKRAYESSINMMSNFIKQKYPQYWSDCSPSGSIVIPLPADVVMEMFGHLARKSDGTLKSHATVQGYKSGLKNLYRERRVEFCPQLELSLSDFNSGYKRTIADLKEQGQMKLTEGKSHLTFDRYKYLCNLSYRRCTSTHKPLHLRLEWNTLSRNESVSTISYEHICWEADCLQITHARHKSDQNGSSAFAKHIYANPDNPEICSILCFGLHVICCQYQNDRTRHKVFDGQDEEGAFEAFFNDMLRRLTPDERLRTGIVPEDLGTHSIRKGACSYLLGLENVVCLSAVYLRMGWSLGNVQKRYIFGGPGADQVLGRTVAGLNSSSERFALLPPHFSSENVMTIEQWQEAIPGFSSYPERFRVAIPYLTASVVFHMEWLKLNLPANHSLFTSRFYRLGYHDILKDKVTIGINRSPSGISATGIPSFLGLAINISSLSSTLQELGSSLKRQLDSFDEEMPRKTAREVLNNCEVTGAVNVTMMDLERVLKEQLAEFRASQELRFQDASLLNAPSQAGASANSTGGSLFSWGGRLHCVPENFKMPSCDVKTLWEMWNFGIPSNNIGPLKRLKAFDLSLKSCKVSLTHARVVMSELDKCMPDHSNLAVMSVEQRDAAFNQAYKSLLLQFHDETRMLSRRLGVIKYRTVYEDIQHLKKQ
jgi:hypothetical protein